MSQPSTDLHPTPPFITINNPTNTEDNVQEGKKKRKNRLTKRPPPTGQRFVPNADPSKPPSVYVPVDQEDYSDEDIGYHCYESKKLNSIASDNDNQPHVFPQGNLDAPTREVRLKLEMEFKIIKAFQRVVRKFNILFRLISFYYNLNSILAMLMYNFLAL
ncbi:hypothetical protein PIB30_104923 [Stylosanthes scabra]|uniref:Uncharacterized protein n=1 Tax=Stylosanthes scabra TaxID=79078 RepID=A0ABU6T0S7_9FABA|nr:hypothetical protein [Stylosanthes scabra]